METAAAIVGLAEIWGWIGLAVASVFLTIGMDRIDENARGAYIFRPLLIPAVILLWPLVLWRWAVLETGRDVWALRHAPPRRAHGGAALIMAALIIGAVAGGAAIRQTWPAHIAPEKLAEAGS